MICREYGLEAIPTAPILELRETEYHGALGFDAGLTVLGMNIRSFRIEGCPCRLDIHVSNIVIMNTGIPTESNTACIRLQLVRNHINSVCGIFIE